MAEKQPDTTMYAYVRGEKILNRRKLGADTRHAARDDGAVFRRQRPDADPECLAMAWRAGICPEMGRELEPGEWLPIAAPEPLPEPTPKGTKKPRRPRRPVPWVADLREAVDARMAETGAQPHWRDNQALALAIGIGISRQWIAEGGDVHDPANERNVRHRDETKKWLMSLFGDGLLALRADYDEYGAGWIDAYVLPVIDLDSGGRPSLDALAGAPGATPEPVPTVAVTAALAEINRKYNYSPRARPFVGLVESWFRWASVELDPRLERGVPANITRARHVRADEFRAEVEEAENAARDARDETKKEQDRRDAAQDEANKIEAALDDLDNRHTRTLERIQADRDLARRIRDAARRIQHNAQAIQNARDTLPDALLGLIEDPHIEDTLARIAAQELAELPELPEPEPGQQSRPRREDEDEPGRSG